MSCAGTRRRFITNSVRRMHHAMDELTRTFDEFVQADSDLEVEAKVGVGAVFALRPWEAPAFTKLRRVQRG